MPMGDGTGSTSGLRFNPRYSAEELEEDSIVGREDSEERAKHEAKKQEKQEKRARLLQGIQHLKIKIPQQNKEDEEHRVWYVAVTRAKNNLYKLKAKMERKGYKL